jgi:hypothetical protein
MLNVRNFLLTLACFFLLSTVALGMGERPILFSGDESTKLVVVGEILHIEEELYLVEDSSGKKMNMHVDHSSQVAGRPKKGDRIVAQVNENGHVLKVQVADPTNIPIP